MIDQLNLFTEIVNIYNQSEAPISNEVLYKQVVANLSLSDSVLSEKSPVGKGALSYNLFKRKVRWFQQSLKQAGVIDRVTGKRGEWCVKREKKNDLDKVLPHLSVIGFSTKLGVAILGYSESVFSALNEPTQLIVCSPPYPLATPRKYGNVKESEYVDWICKTIEPVIKNLVDGGSLALNLGQDIFEQGSPARSMYKERLLLALNDRYGLYMVDTLVWHNPSKPPGPIAWASKQRVQLNVAWEPVYWLTNNPHRLISDNRRVLQPHSEKHLALINAGGEKRTINNSDGAYRLYEGSYGNKTEGKIPRNVIVAGQSCADNRAYRKRAIADGYTPHGATMPLKLASFLIEFMTEPEHLVVDPFAGSFTTGKAAENLGRRWIGVDPIVDYVLGAASRFEQSLGFKRNLALS